MKQIHKLLLACGIVSSCYYVAINVIVPMYYPGYDIAAYTISELSAIDAPTRSLWNVVGLFYTLLVICFGIGMWLSSGNNKKLRIAAVLMLVYGLSGFFWPPMHRREVIAAGGGTLTDDLHIAYGIFTVILYMFMMYFASRGLDKWFKNFSIIVFMLFIIFGVFTGIEGPKLSKGLDTPLLGVWERINIGLFMVWNSVFAIRLMKAQRSLQYNGRFRFAG